ncbi:MAG: hypothetical protein DCC49_01560 [Acidobacteria bacterium]|nr:MAG: hypothetical protein DCC49_01560 [Acidobacteriota bacterium]
MLTVLLPAFSESEGVEVSLSYRRSDAYEQGLTERIGEICTFYPVSLPEVADLEARIRARLSGRAMKPIRGLVIGLMHILPIRQVFQLYDLAPLRKVFSRVQPDIVHINNGGFPGAGSANAAALASHLAGVRSTVYVVNNIAYGHASPLRWAGFPIDRLVARWTGRFVTGSGVAAERLCAVLRLKHSRVEVIPNAIAPREPDESKGETRRRLGIGAEETLIACVARLEKRKGHRVLVEAAAIARPVRGANPVTILVEGDGPERESIEAAIARFRGEVTVRMISPERNIWNLLQASDAIVLPSLDREDFPNVVLEAMSMSKAVIASRVGGVPEQVIDGTTGIIVPPGNVLALAKAIEKLTSEKALLRELGRNGRLHYERQFAPEAAIRRYMNLYRSLIAVSGELAASSGFKES